MYLLSLDFKDIEDGFSLFMYLNEIHWFEQCYLKSITNYYD